jgi:hypothetical protein
MMVVPAKSQVTQCNSKNGISVQKVVVLPKLGIFSHQECGQHAFPRKPKGLGASNPGNG